MDTKLTDFVEALYAATNFDQAFDALEKEVLNLGLDGVLYTYIPKPLITNGFRTNPVYKLSREYAPDFIAHYTQAKFEKDDPLIQAVQDGVTAPINWWGDICNVYRHANPKADEVIRVSRSYGISHGMTLPLLCESSGISGASFISEDPNGFDQLIEERGRALFQRTQLFHSLIMANTQYLAEFEKPLLSELTTKELRYLAGLARGHSNARIAIDLGLSEKYLEQVMLRIRRKVSGVGRFDAPTVNRNQLMYYAGLLHLLDHEAVAPEDS